MIELNNIFATSAEKIQETPVKGAFYLPTYLLGSGVIASRSINEQKLVED